MEGEGTMELTAKEAGGAKRMDLKEASAYLRSMAHHSAQAAFRYHRQPGESPALALDWTRFADSKLLAAVAESATVTTLVTSEGRSLTEVKLMVRNREQPFLKVSLPAGATIVSAEVAGQTVKPAIGADGSRVPLLRAGFRPIDAYEVSFVMMHSGAPFARKGGSELALPKMDVPIGLVNWEVYLPERYRVKNFGGDAIAAALLPGAGIDAVEVRKYRPPTPPPAAPMEPGTIGGYVMDGSGAYIARAHVTVTNEQTGAVSQATADETGHWVAMGVGPGNVKVEVYAPGFPRVVRQVELMASQGSRVDVRLEVSPMLETVQTQMAVTVTAGALDTRSEKQAPPQQQAYQPSVNVANLQKRVSGVLPIRVDVPKAGNSFRFARALVVDDETKLTFAYRADR